MRVFARERAYLAGKERSKNGPGDKSISLSFSLPQIGQFPGDDSARVGSTQFPLLSKPHLEGDGDGRDDLHGVSDLGVVLGLERGEEVVEAEEGDEDACEGRERIKNSSKKIISIFARSLVDPWIRRGKISEN